MAIQSGPMQAVHRHERGSEDAGEESLNLTPMHDVMQVEPGAAVRAQTGNMHGSNNASQNEVLTVPDVLELVRVPIHVAPAGMSLRILAVCAHPCLH